MDNSQRVKSNNIELITFLRGFSIMAVIIFHYSMTLELPSPFNTLVYGGGTGVHLFVLLSGFGLYLSQKRKELSYPQFLIKRLTKIYIPYIIIVSLSAVVSLILPVFDNSLYAYLGHVFLFKMFDETIMGSYGYPFWFISMIIQFYLLFHLIVKIKKRLTNLTFFLLCLTASVLWTVVIIKLDIYQQRIWNSFFLRYIWEFALGIIIADSLEQIKNTSKTFLSENKAKSIAVIFFQAIVSLAIFGYLAVYGGEYGKLLNDIPALIGFSSVAIFIYLLSIRFFNNAILWIGQYSYALYLLHMVVLKITENFVDTSVYVVVVSLILCFVLSYFYQRFSDKLINTIQQSFLQNGRKKPDSRIA